MSNMTLVALLDFPGPYNGETVKKGEKFEAASEQDKHVFTTIGHAKVADLDAVKVNVEFKSLEAEQPEKARTEKQIKREYRTRDMKAQT